MVWFLKSKGRHNNRIQPTPLRWRSAARLMLAVGRRGETNGWDGTDDG